MTSVEPAAGASPRSLAEDLRRRSPDELRAMLTARPDLLRPPPADLTALAARAGSAASVARALDDLDRVTLAVAEALAALPDPVDPADLLLGFPAADEPQVLAAVDRILGLGLAWGAPGIRLVRTAREAFGPHPAGLGPALAATRPRLGGLDAEALAEVLAEAPPGAEEVLERLAWGTPVGQVPGADRPVSTRSARTPVEWLLARDLLVPTGPGTVVLPREVGLALRTRRHGRPLLSRGLVADPSTESDSSAEDGPAVDRSRSTAASGQRGLASIRSVTSLLAAWDDDPPAVLRKGGLGVRDLAQTARLLDEDESATALWIEIAHQAGLLGRDGEAEERWRPTAAADDWSELSPAEQWEVLARAWLDAPRAPALVRGLAAPHDPVNALSDDAGRPAHPRLRRDVLAVLVAAADEGGRVPGSEEIVRRVRDRRPRAWSPQHPAHIAAILAEAEALGVTGHAALSPAGHALVEDVAARASVPAAAARMAESLPPTVEHIWIQADLTAVAPGPLPGNLDRLLRGMAEVESTGGATVYRFTETSILRALDRGRDGAAILADLERLSRTEIPQPLRYLIDDLDRRHGSVRVGVAASYVRCPDPATARSLLGDPRARDLHLRELAPGVLVSPSAPPRVVETLRDLGLAPAGEAPDGSILLPPRGPRRAPVPAPPGAMRPPTVDPRILDATVRSLLGAHSPAPGEAPVLEAMTATEVLARLRTASTERASVWIAFADSDGSTATLAVDPLRIAGGRLTGIDRGTGELGSWPLSRIGAASPVGE